MRQFLPALSSGRAPVALINISWPLEFVQFYIACVVINMCGLKLAVPSSQETGLGEIDNRAICVQVSSADQKRKPQCKYIDEDRYLIGKYRKERGASRAAAFFKSKYPTLNESTVRVFVTTKTLKLQMLLDFHLKNELSYWSEGGRSW